MSDDYQSFEEDVSVYLIDKTDSSEYHEREYYRMRILKTIAPFLLNTEETYGAVLTIKRFASVLPVYIIA